LKMSLENMKEFAGFINSNKKDIDHQNYIVAIQERISGFPLGEKLAIPKRKLLKEGILFSDKGKKYYTHLFNDILLCTIPKSKDKLKFERIISLPTSAFIPAESKDLKYDFVLIATTGTYGFAVPFLEKESWINSVIDAIDRSKDVLLGSAFSDGIESHQGTGTQFEQFREDIHKQKRSLMATRILESEKQYVETLKKTIQLFQEPIQKAAPSPYPILSERDVIDIFINLKTIYNTHINFVAKLQPRVESWSESSLLGDLFLSHVVEIIVLYETYAENYPTSVKVNLDKMHNNVNFMTFLVQTETENKVSLNDLLEKPLKQMSNYYLLLEELSSYTFASHEDKETVRVVLERVKAFTTQHKNAMHNSLKRNSVSSPHRSRSQTMTPNKPSKSISSSELKTKPSSFSKSQYFRRPSASSLFS